MSWEDRIIEAAYVSPRGTRATFQYENVSEEFDKKTTAFNFPDAPGTYVQDLGHTGRRYPLRLFFWGSEYDTEADAFTQLLTEAGPGRLEHPKYGTITVVPFGTIKRRDDLKTAANQAIIEVVFWETTGVVYPLPQVDNSTAVLTSVSEYNTAAAAQYEASLTSETLADTASVKSRYLLQLDKVKAGLSSIADTQADVQQQFNGIYDSINNSIDILIGEPVTLASQTIAFVQSPARAVTAILARLTGYSTLITDMLSRTEEDFDSIDDFLNGDLYNTSYVSAQVVSVVNNQFSFKSEVLGAAETILDAFIAVAEWRDVLFGTYEIVDTGEAYQQLQEAVALAAGFLVEISFTLKQERSVVLDRARNIIDLVAEFYGNIDENLDFFINSNSLTGSEILEVPKGREVVYYV